MANAVHNPRGGRRKHINVNTLTLRNFNEMSTGRLWGKLTALTPPAPDRDRGSDRRPSRGRSTGARSPAPSRIRRTPGWSGQMQPYSSSGRSTPDSIGNCGPFRATFAFCRQCLLPTTTADSGPSRGDHCRRANRPTETSTEAVCYDRLTSIPAGRNAQRPAIRRRLGELVNSTLCCPSRAAQ
jgi:hypothetical protein